jgi:hypothetical protein
VVPEEGDERDKKWSSKHRMGSTIVRAWITVVYDSRRYTRRAARRLP